MTPDQSAIARQLERARGGSKEALWYLLAHSRTYLLSIAAKHCDARLRGKVSPSDVAEDAILMAHRGFESFRGTTPPEWLGWLRQILVNQMMNCQKKYYVTQKRRAKREISVHGKDLMNNIPAVGHQSPSSVYCLKESRERLLTVMKKMTKESQLIINLRYRDQLSFEAIGERLRKSPDAVRMQFARAIKWLQTEMEAAT